MARMRRFSMIKRLLEYLGDAVILTFGLMSVLLFTTLLTKGRLALVEPNQCILIGELILAALCFLFGIERLIDDLKKRGKRR